MAKITNPRVRLGRGQRTSGDALLWEARRAFLAAVYTVSPETYHWLFPDGFGQDAYDAYRRRWNDDPEMMIAKWQGLWKLPDQWLADVARNTLRARLKGYVEGVPLHLTRDAFVTPKARIAGSGDALNVPKGELYWNPTDETRDGARRRLMAAIDSELQRVENRGTLVRIKTKSPEHFVWLARFQVLGESGQEIAGTLPDTHPEKFRNVEERARAVQLGINDTKELIGLRLRDDPYRSAKKSRNE